MCSWLAHEAFPAALQVAEAIKRDGGDAAALAGDVTADDFPKRCIGAAMDKWGTVDILVNNAGTHAAAASHAPVDLVPARAVTTASRSSRSCAIHSRALLYGRCMAMTESVNSASYAYAGFTWDGMIHKITPKQWDAMLAVHCTAPFRLIQASPRWLPVPPADSGRARSVDCLARRRPASSSACLYVATLGVVKGCDCKDAAGGTAALMQLHGSRSAWQTRAVWQGRVRAAGFSGRFRAMAIPALMPGRAQAAAPVMREAAKRELDAGGAARSRCIINVSSTSGTHGNAGQANYSTVRAAGLLVA